MSVETYGWDTVFAVELGFFNEMIGAAPPVAHRIDFSTGHGQTPDGTMTWQAGPWQVTQVYGGQITLAATFETGELTSPSGAFDLAGSQVTITADLALARFSGDPRRQERKLGPVGQTGWALVKVTPRSGDFNEQLLTTLALNAFLDTPDALAWFAGLFDDLTVHTEQGVAGADPLKPRSVRFAGGEQADAAKAVAVMATTRDDDIAGLPLMISPLLLEKGDRAAFAFSPDCFLALLVRPALARMFGTDPGTVETDFPLRDGGIIVNQKQLTLLIEDPEHRQHPATLDPGNLRVHIDGNEMHFAMTDLTFRIDVGAVNVFTVKMQYSETMAVELVDAAGSDKKVLVFHTLGDPIVIHETEEALAAFLTELGVQLVLLIAEVLVLKFMPAALKTRGFSLLATRFLTALTLSLLAGLGITVGHTGEIVNEIEKGTFANFPSFADVLDTPLLSVQWRPNGRFRPVSAALCGGLLCKLEHIPQPPTA